MTSPPSSDALEALFQTLRQTGDVRALANPDRASLAAQIVERLKQEADHYWAIDPEESLTLAGLIVAVGEARGDPSTVALGRMAQGDALKFLGQFEAAWARLDQARDLYQAVDDEVGWARTCIGRLYLSINLNRVAEALAEAQQARAILTRRGEAERLLRLNFQTALVHNYLGQPAVALEWFQAALATAEALGDAGQQYLGPLYTNIGFAYDVLGDLRLAQSHAERAQALFVERGESLNQATVEINLAYLARAQGHYPRALRQLHAVVDLAEGRFPETAALARCDLAECYLALGRYAEARDLARQVAGDYRTAGNQYQLARALLHLATAEAELADFAAAATALEEAAHLFETLGAAPWVATTQLLRGRLALRQGERGVAATLAEQAGRIFEAEGHLANTADARLLCASAALAGGDPRLAVDRAAGTLAYARRYNVPSLRYSAHLLLGRAAEADAHPARAARHYQAAAATVERVQRGLTITLRPGFLEGQAEASRRLIDLRLRLGQAAAALEALEQAKSQVLLGYLVNREHLRWAPAGADSAALIETLERLRAEHHWYYRLAHDPPREADHASSLPTELARAEVTTRERQMRAITERLYLHAEAGRVAQAAPVVSVAAVQASLDEGTALVEYYTDGEALWAFTLSRAHLRVQALPATLGSVQAWLGQLQLNLTAALRLGPDAAATRALRPTALRLLQRLQGALLGPLALQPEAWQRLVIVPYGGLHYLPFHLLHDGTHHLIERHEVVVVPAAGLATRPGPRQPPGALALAYDWDGRLLHTQAEAELVVRLFGGERRLNEAARRPVLQAAPRQILHVAAHGQYRLDQPDLSYLQLADGPLFADDLLQHDLRYELVTLSACETGRATVAGGEELIGLGRGLLYAGAGALWLSLWSVPDAATLRLMDGFYRRLRAGASKAAAARRAQCALLAEAPELHPAFWGAFQLVGDAHPLSTTTES